MGEWYKLIGVYSLAQVAGATLTGLVFATIGVVLHGFYPWRSLDAIQVLVAVGLVCALLDLQLLPFRVPSRCWQVPQSWKQFSPPLMAASFGAGIGLGVLTRIPFASFYFVLAACMAVASWPLGVGLIALYGASRAMTVAVVARAQFSAADPHGRLKAIGGLSPVIGYLDGLVMALLGGLLLGSLLT